MRAAMPVEAPALRLTSATAKSDATNSFCSLSAASDRSSPAPLSGPENAANVRFLVKAWGLLNHVLSSCPMKAVLINTTFHLGHHGCTLADRQLDLLTAEAGIDICARSEEHTSELQSLR